MRYVLAIKQGIYGSQGAYLAYQVAQELLAQGHIIEQIFFFQDGVSNANKWVDPANDEFHLLNAWKNLAQSHRLSLHLCIAAAQRRGIVEANLAEGFTLAGLGEFSQAVFTADRLLTF
ncbi:MULTISPECIES: sulfurtransferase complex subunit TusD [Glaesserella]|uniref:Sulfurtransferase complex subunit TusD n=1 Tax=Glaesserella australis TaxID=2094024 RepID=A0A328C206_9PAST|nr:MULTISPECIES: sulfurtransferase complex subunit TusD [Glaesserella]AUI66745.1 sulfurtransferase complex subunit TusD [Glaesserella sp. 15-184]RAL19797.1 sulfurtransferase complex subunit TusD [Glaesserella australis]